jgi:hypothetical protein|tara:strand:- start:643 stop:861 length:219 start_codon:yes stop_codon:yes gene_type:complete
MELYRNGIRTDRALILFINIQHISWNKTNKDEYEVKIYSSASAQPIMQRMAGIDLESFLEQYKYIMGVTKYE